MKKSFKVDGFITSSGTRWVKISDNEKHCWVPFSDFHGHGKEAIARLSRGGVIIVGSARVKKLMDEVAGIEQFYEAELVEHIGWNGKHFALPDGTVFSPEGCSSDEVLFEISNNKCSAKGDAETWLQDVAAKLANQSIPIFGLCLTFAAAILRLTNRVGNFGFELVGGKGTGKSTVQQLMSSVLGGAIQGDDGHYYISFDATANGLEQEMSAHSDIPMILEEANLFLAGESPKMRGEHFKAIAFRLAGGTDKRRFDQRNGGEYRFVYMSSSNERLADLIDNRNEAASAAADRFITLELFPSRKHGVFDKIPHEYATAGQYAGSLIAAANNHHGHAIRVFLKQLVQDRHDDEDILRANIERSVRLFQKKSNADLDNGSAARVAEAFGIVYAGGVLAQQYGALPQGLKCGKAVLDCYKMYLLGNHEASALLSTLQAIAGRNDTAKIGFQKHGGTPLPSSDCLEAVPAFLKKVGTKRELWIKPDRIHHLIPGWARLKNKPEIIALLKRDGDHKTVKRTLPTESKPARVYCFELPKQNKKAKAKRSNNS